MQKVLINCINHLKYFITQLQNFYFSQNLNNANLFHIIAIFALGVQLLSIFYYIFYILVELNVYFYQKGESLE